MANVTWCWRKWIAPGSEEQWISRLHEVGCVTPSVTELPGRVRLLLAVYAAQHKPMALLHEQFGGHVRSLRQNEWLPLRATPPTLVGDTLEILHEKSRSRPTSAQLLIPHGVAFGSGEHATTYMLLRALTREKRLNRVLDLGTGSGVLALAARRFGAKKIVATDFDPDAVRTAKQNEALNFSKAAIHWSCADVKKLSIAVRYDLVLANLFSGILIAAAPRVVACVSRSGKLWMSGILRTQQDDVVAAYRREGLRLIYVTRRGKWVMLQMQW